MDLEHRRRQDRRELIRLGLVLIGGASLLGSLVGAILAGVHEAVVYWTAGEVEAQ